MCWGSARQMSVHVSHISSALSQLIQALCCLMHAILLVLSSSIAALTASWTGSHLPLPWALLHWAIGKLHKPDLPIATATTTALCLSLAFTASSSLVALHFLLVSISMLATETFGVLESLYCSASLVQMTLDSSVMLLSGSCRMLFFPYRAALLRLQGKPNQLWRYPLIFLSILSTDVMGTS